MVAGHGSTLRRNYLKVPIIHRSPTFEGWDYSQFPKTYGGTSPRSATNLDLPLPRTERIENFLCGGFGLRVQLPGPI
jgi:hypothetical protein